MEGIGYIGGGLGSDRETIDVRDGEGNEGDERRVEIEVLELRLSLFGQQERDGVASGGKLVGEVEERSYVADG